MSAFETDARGLAARIAAARAYVCARLANARGDTIVEALMALLIAAMGAAALATMVMAAMNATITTQETRDKIYQAESTMVKSSDISSAAIISVGAGEGVSAQDCSVKVALYVSPDGTFVRYVDTMQEAAS